MGVGTGAVAVGAGVESGKRVVSAVGGDEPLVALSGGEASGCVVADDCAGGAFVAVVSDCPG